MAYALATAFHETCGRDAPDRGDTARLRWQDLTATRLAPTTSAIGGRGYVQLTWYENFLKAEGVLKDTYDLPTFRVSNIRIGCSRTSRRPWCFTTA